MRASAYSLYLMLFSYNHPPQPSTTATEMSNTISNHVQYYSRILFFNGKIFSLVCVIEFFLPTIQLQSNLSYFMAIGGSQNQLIMRGYVLREIT